MNLKIVANLVLVLSKKYSIKSSKIAVYNKLIADNYRFKFYFLFLKLIRVDI